MWRHLLIVLLGTATLPVSQVTAVKGLMYMRQVDAKFHDFLSSGDNVKVVYFCKDFASKKEFLAEMEKSAGVMTLYDAEFALVDCSTNPKVGHCEVSESDYYVYIYQKNALMVTISLDSMFDIDSIVSNVLQCVLLYDAPILQTAGERASLEAVSKGHIDIVYTFQNALGTYEHRIMMEVAYVHRDEYRFAVTTEREPVNDLPGFVASADSAVWVLLCKQVTDEAEPCPTVKYTGVMDRNSLARYFRVRNLPAIHDVGRDGDFDPFTDNDLHSVFIHYDASSQSSAEQTASELIDAFLGQIGVILTNIDEVATDTAKFGSGRKLPALSVKFLNEDQLRHMPDGRNAVHFVTEQLNSLLAPPGESLESTAANDDNSAIEAEYSYVLKQDDEVAEVMAELQKMESFYNMDNIMHLNSTTFHSVTQDQHQTVMVLFYVTFDARCQVLLSTYNDVAKDLANEGLRPLAAIDCFSWTDVCELADVSEFPLIRIYRPNADFVPYSGYLSKAALYAAIKLHHTDSPLLLKTTSDVEEFVSGCPPREIEASSCVLGLFGTSHESEIERFDMVAALMQGEVAFGRTVDGDIATARCEKVGVPSPCIVVVRRNDHVSTFSTVSPKGSSDTLVESIRRARLSRLPELSADQFASYYALGQPFLIAFINVDQLPPTTSSLMPIMEELAKNNGPFDGMVVCAWMDTSKPDGVGGQVVRHYVNTPRTEELLLIDRKMGSVHRLDAPLPTALDAVQTWLDTVLSNRLMPTSRLSVEEWTAPVPPIDFLSRVDEHEGTRVTQQISQTDDAFAYANEHGIDIADDNEALPVKDIDRAVESELNKLQYSRLRTTGSGSQMSAEHSRKQSQITHTEL